MSESVTLDIGHEFSKHPGGRYRKNGDYSGQDFRERLLLPKLNEALEKKQKLNVIIDTVTRSYQVSFLDEAFGGLVRDHGFDKKQILSTIEFVCRLDRFNKYKLLAIKFLENA